MRMPEWRAVVGSEGRYEVSDDGQMRSLTFAGRPRSEPKILKQRLDRDGYKRLNVIDGGKHTTWRVHRVVSAAFLGPCPDGMVPDHINRIRTDNRIENLRYLSERENGSKFTEEQVREVRRLTDDGMPTRKVAAITGISNTHVGRIKHGKSWDHLFG
jgi:hypothetical protein